MRWDVHNHVTPRAALARLDDEAIPISISGDVISADRVRFEAGPYFTDPAAKLEELEKMGLEAAILSVAPPLLAYEADAKAAVPYCEAVNEGLAAHCTVAPDRLRWLAHVPMQSPDDAAAGLARAVEQGAVGAQVGTSVAGQPLDAPELEPFWAAAADLGVPVLLHPAYNGPNPGLDAFYLQNVIGNQLETTIATERLICAGTLDRHPGLRLMLVHAGGYLPWQIGRLRHARGVRPELSEAPAEPKDALGQIVVDTITHDPEILRMLIERMGADAVAMGTDGPFDMATPEPVRELTEAVGEDVARTVMEKSPVELFGLQ